MKYYLFLTLLVSQFFFSGSVYAETHVVSPMLIEHVFEPRDSIEHSIKITNTSDRKLILYPTVNEIILGDDDEVKDFVAPSMTDRTSAVTSWLEIQRGRVEINSRETVKIPLIIKIHPEAKPGTYHALVSFPAGSQRHVAEVKIASRTVPGTMVRIDISDMTTSQLRLQRFSTERFVYNNDTESVSVMLQNTGDVPIKPRGEIIMYDTRGREISTVSLTEYTSVITPGNTDSFAVSLPKELGMGRYKAFLVLEYGDTQTATIYDTTFFTKIPMMFLLSVFILLLLSTLIISLWYHRRHRNTLPLMQAGETIPFYVRSHITATDNDHDIQIKK